MSTGFQILKPRVDPRDLDLAKFMKENENIFFPQDFIEFVNSFELGHDEYYISHFYLEKVWSTKHDFMFSLCEIERHLTPNNKIEKVVIDYFFTTEYILDRWKDSIQNEQLFFDKSLLPFGILFEPTHTRLFVGVGEENSGEIWIDLNEEDRYKHGDDSLFVASDIENFIAECKQVFKDGIFQEYPTHLLYKNWGEDFWRIREE
jgi:hypothetical protein